jgi:hypothetical protein
VTQRPGYTATYDTIRKFDDYMPPDPAHRNAIIWRAVQAALEAEDREVVNPLRADLDNAERDNRRLADEVKRLEARLERARAEYETHERAYDMVDGDLYQILTGTGGSNG